MIYNVHIYMHTKLRYPSSPKKKGYCASAKGNRRVYGHLGLWTKEYHCKR